MQENYKKYLTNIGGEGGIVKIDECTFVKRKYNKNHRVEGVGLLVWSNGQKNGGLF